MRQFLHLFTLLSSLTAFSQNANPPLTITHLTGNFYIYTTYGDAGNGNMYPANGMYLVTNQGVVLMDTPWDTTQFQPLLDSIIARHHQKVVMSISTHFHADRTGGLTYYTQKGIQTYTSKMTDDLSKAKHEPRAAHLIYRDTVFKVGQYSFETFYPGKGHSPDNIVLWFGQEKVLYGGCFIKSVDTNSPGNLSDAHIDEWIISLQKVQAKYGKPNYIIPGHQDWTSKKALTHTLKILKKYQRKNDRGTH
jgi:metallo-beta-lactamase class B